MHLIYVLIFWKVENIGNFWQNWELLTDKTFFRWKCKRIVTSSGGRIVLLIAKQLGLKMQNYSIPKYNR